MNAVRMTEGALESGHGRIRQWQQGGSHSIKMPDGCPVLLPFPAIVVLLSLMKRGVSSLLKSTSEFSVGYGTIS